MASRINVEEFTVPEAGTDITEITIEEEYYVEGLGEDRITLTGTLVAERAEPLLGEGANEVNWESSTVVAGFTHLDVRGESAVFGPVNVHLDKTSPAFGIVTNGKCKASLPIVVTMPDHDLVLISARPIQLESTVKTVPPIGDERTVSRGPVDLVDRRTLRTVGTIRSARVMWRELVAQTRTYER